MMADLKLFSSVVIYTKSWLIWLIYLKSQLIWLQVSAYLISLLQDSDIHKG